VTELEQRLRDQLAGVEQEGLLRHLSPPQGIDLSSNDYLGLSTHPLLKQRMSDAVLQEGCGSTGSRLLRGDRDSFAIAEREFAAFKGVERSLYFSSGYLANLAVLTTFPEPEDVIFSDERNHASLIDGTRLSRARRVVFPHNDVETLGRLMAAESGQKFLVTESLFSMDGDTAPLREYAELCREHRAALIVDEAHAVGIYGGRGSGLIEERRIAEDVFLSVNTAGKAFGLCGAFVAGSSTAIEFMIQRARPFIFSTAPPPAVASALSTAIQIIQAEPERRERLKRNAGYLRDLLLGKGIELPPETSHIIPVLIGDNKAAVAIAHSLQRDGFDVRAIRPPSVPPGTARLRISVNSELDEQALRRFAAALGHLCSREALSIP
jgi:8-amino-7-oxononanoate synthase